EPADSQAAGSRFESEGAHLINKVKVRTVVPLRSGQFWCALPQRFADRNEVVASDKNPTEGEVGEVQRASRHDLVRALAPRYGHVAKGEKSQILNQLCGVTGYTRKYALTLLMHPPPEELQVKRTRSARRATGQP